MPDLYCAVPEHKPVPPFIQAPAWEFAGRTAPDEPRPQGFSDEVARFAAEFQGFYTFHATSILERRRSAD
jgi:hypothetical protein